jgi:DNA-binding CsgD family transcriptional regulator
VRRTVSLNYMDDTIPYESPPPPKLSRYVSHTRDNTPFEALLWAEIRKIEKQTHMTAWQAECFEWYLMGYSLQETAEVLGCSRQNVHKRLTGAFIKAKSFRRRGLLTVMVETFGFTLAMKQMRESLADRIDRDAPQHPKARAPKPARKPDNG